MDSRRQSWHGIGGNGEVLILNYLTLVIGLLTFVSGARMCLFPRARRLAAEARVSQRKSELEQGASEKFFEERRTLQAYPLLKTDGKWRAKGAIMTLCGALLIALSFVR